LARVQIPPPLQFKVKKMLAYESKNLKVFEVDGDQVCFKLNGDHLFVFVDVGLRSVGMSFVIDDTKPSEFFETVNTQGAINVINAVRNSDDDEIEIEIAPTIN
jgi:hypothetical protein